MKLVKRLLKWTTGGLLVVFLLLIGWGVIAYWTSTNEVPRLIGALMILAGFGWLTFLMPPLAQSLAPFNMLPGAIGELSLTLWLLIKGVNVQRWNEQKNNTHP